MKRKKGRGIFYSTHVIEKTLIHHLIEWCATLLSIIGVLLVNLQNLNGLYLWIPANILWIAFSWKHKHYGLLVLSCSYLLINIIGLINWKLA